LTYARTHCGNIIQYYVEPWNRK